MAIDKRRSTAMMIHSFAVAHAATAAALANTMVGDEAALTALTVAMIIAVAKLNGADWDTGTALAFLGVLAGGYIGTRGAVLLVKWIPGIGNAANAAVTFGTTEVLGWATYAFINKAGSNADPREIDKKEASALWKEAKSTRDAEKRMTEQLYERMSSDDRKRMREIARELSDNGLSTETRKVLEDEMEGIIAKYIRPQQSSRGD